MRGTCERGAPEPAAERRGLLPMHRSARGPLPLLPTTHAAARALPPHAHPNRLPCRPARVLPCPCLAARAAQHGRRDTLSKRGMEAARCSPLLAGVLLLAGLGEAGPMRLLALVVSRVVCAGWGRAGQSATGQTPQSGAAVESLEMPCAARGAGRARAGHRLRASRPLEGLDCAQRPAPSSQASPSARHVPRMREARAARCGSQRRRNPSIGRRVAARLLRGRAHSWIWPFRRVGEAPALLCDPCGGSGGALDARRGFREPLCASDRLEHRRSARGRRDQQSGARMQARRPFGCAKYCFAYYLFYVSIEAGVRRAPEAYRARRAHASPPI
jgi:hypothetical protein